MLWSFCTDIEAFKKKIEEEAPSSCPPVPQSSKESKDIALKPNTQKKNEVAKAKKPNDDDIPLRKLHKQLKKKTSKKSKKLTEKRSNSREGPIDQKKDDTSLGTSTQTSARTVSNSDKSASNVEDALPNSKPPKKRKMNNIKNATNEDLNTESGNINKQAPSSSNGPHGDLLGSLFSSEVPISKSKEKAIANAAAKPSSTKDEHVFAVSKASSMTDEADDDKLSVAGVLLGLGK